MFFVGCSSNLQNVMRDNSLDRVETAKGMPNKDGDYDAREENLAVDAIRDQEVKVDPKKGYPILVDNRWNGNMSIEIEIRKNGFFLRGPIIKGFDFDSLGSKEDFLMPGTYEVTFKVNSFCIFAIQDLEVTTAPIWDSEAQKSYNLVIKVPKCPRRMRHYGYRRR
jgi:hypothetical protein